MYSVQTNRFSSLEVTSIRGFGSGQANPLLVVTGPSAGFAPPPPQAASQHGGHDGD